MWVGARSPHSGVGGTTCVFPKYQVKGYFSRNKLRHENCKKGGVFDFSPKGVVFFLSFFGLLRNKKKGVIKYLCLLYLKIINNLIKSRAQIPEIPASFEQCSGFRGVSKAGKGCEKPAKWVFIPPSEKWKNALVLSMIYWYYILPHAMLYCHGQIDLSWIMKLSINYISEQPTFRGVDPFFGWGGGGWQK